MVGVEKAKDHRPIYDLMSGTFRILLLNDRRDLSGLYCEIKSSRSAS